MPSVSRNIRRTSEHMTADASTLWEGISREAHQRISRFTTTDPARELTDRLSTRFRVNYGDPMPYGMPVALRYDAGTALAQLTTRVWRLVEEIVRLYPQVPEIRDVISLPPQLAGEDSLAEAAGHQRMTVDICRPDFLLDASQRPMLVEVNANCPGGVINAGEASRQWRMLLEKETGAEFRELPFETPDWLASGLIDAFEDAGLDCTRVAVIQDTEGWRHEVREIAQSFRNIGRQAVLVDPCSWGSTATGPAAVATGYQKISVQRLLSHISAAPEYFTALRSGSMNVQNGHAARFVADNKLCLAVLSDPAFEQYFDVSEFRHVRPHIPWSRNIARCPAREVAEIRANPGLYVLKHPLSTRGTGVILGKDCSSLPEWEESVDRAIADHWLVQEWVDSWRIERWPGHHPSRHDISAFCLRGRFVGAFMRGSAGGRLNVQQGGYTHPVLMAPDGWE